MREPGETVGVILEGNTVRVADAVRKSGIKPVPLGASPVPVRTRLNVPTGADNREVIWRSITAPGLAGLDEKVLAVSAGKPTKSNVTGVVNVAEEVMNTL